MVLGFYRLASLSLSLSLSIFFTHSHSSSHHKNTEMCKNFVFRKIPTCTWDTQKELKLLLLFLLQKMPRWSRLYYFLFENLSPPAIYTIYNVDIRIVANSSLVQDGKERFYFGWSSLKIVDQSSVQKKRKSSFFGPHQLLPR